MKLSEMDARQKKAFRNVKYAAWDLLGGLENTMLDNDENSVAYKSAKEQLSDHDGLVNELYHMATTAFYDEGFCGFSKAYELYIREINFCAKDFIMECCEKRITKEGY